MTRDYYRRFVREFCGCHDPAAFFEIVDGKKRPTLSTSSFRPIVTVGRLWLEANAVPESSLANEVPTKK